MASIKKLPITKLSYRKIPLSDSQKALFILEFTKELIRNSGEYVYILDNLLKDEEKESKGKVQRRERQINVAVKNKLAPPKIISTPKRTHKISEETRENLKEILSKLDEDTRKPKLRGIMPSPVLKNSQINVPEPVLPERFQYLKPSPDTKEISLGRLDPFLKDPMVRIIECVGPKQNVLVMGGMGTKKTDITLSSEEINEVIDRFSRASKIPVIEGVYKVVVGRFIFLAVISEVIGSRFTIRKMVASMPPQGNRKGQRIPIPQRMPSRRF